MIFGFDIISDLHLVSDSEFDWEGKPTSLYCIVAGNLSDDIFTVAKALHHLSKLYQGVFFIDGALENKDLQSREDTLDSIGHLTSRIGNAVYLHNNVVVVDGIAIVGINGWYKNYESMSTADEFDLKSHFFDDMSYLEKTIERLQLHVDVKKIIIASNCVPSNKLYFGEKGTLTDITLDYVTHADTEHKISHWVFGTHEKIVDTMINGINYLNNPKHDREPYYAKRIEVTI